MFRNIKVVNVSDDDSSSSKSSTKDVAVPITNLNVIAEANSDEEDLSNNSYKSHKSVKQSSWSSQKSSSSNSFGDEDKFEYVGNNKDKNFNAS